MRRVPRDQPDLILLQNEFREGLLPWLSKAIELIQISSQRKQDDPLTLVCRFRTDLIVDGFRSVSSVFDALGRTFPAWNYRRYIAESRNDYITRR
jgi:type IV secretory pathway protease TraF